MPLLFSIVVPVYCGAHYVPRILDSLGRQGLDPSEWELIIVDDASPDGSGQQLLQYANEQVRVILSEENRRQGGARNLGVAAARAPYIAYLDVDDIFADNFLTQAKEAILVHPGLDILLVDNIIPAYGPGYRPQHHRDEQMPPVPGADYFVARPDLPWEPWDYIFRRQFLLDHELRFIEEQQYEDTDYVFRAVGLAASMLYRPIIGVVYTVSASQTCKLGADYRRISEEYACTTRINQVAREFEAERPDLAAAINGHYTFRLRVNALRYIWRLPYSQIRQILRANPATAGCTCPWARALHNHPTAGALLLRTLSPAFRLASFASKKLAKLAL